MEREYDNETAKEWLAHKVREHLNQCFHDIPVISQFSFEIKDIYDGGCFHGTAIIDTPDNQR